MGLWNGNSEIIKLLLDAGEAGVDAKDLRRRTSLSWIA